MEKAIKLKKLIKENEVKTTKVIDINTYTREKLDIDLTKCEKAIVKLKKTISNHDQELQFKKEELIELELELTQLNDLKNYVA
jgi:vacuolar-type H+-ATPase subunit I/STV1